MTGHSQTAAYQVAAEDERDARLAWELPEESQHSLDDDSVGSMKRPKSVKKTRETRRRKKATEGKTTKTKPQAATTKTKPQAATTKTKPQVATKAAQGRGDPPGKIQRASSQDGSDILMKMRMASRRF
jgi:hypothetical protein